MIKECPICGNEININLKFDDGTCKYCKRKYKIEKIKKNKKIFVNITEENDKQSYN